MGPIRGRMEAPVMKERGSYEKTYLVSSKSIFGFP